MTGTTTIQPQRKEQPMSNNDFLDALRRNQGTVTRIEFDARAVEKKQPEEEDRLKVRDLRNATHIIDNEN